jgi:hypothetical protein
MPEPAKPRRPDPARAAQLVTYGDRNFRAGNLHRTAERYAQAQSADPTAAAPRVRMAQVELCRGHYAEAARCYREAMAVEPDWLVHAPDIQAIYGEPGARRLTFSSASPTASRTPRCRRSSTCRPQPSRPKPSSRVVQASVCHKVGFR